MSNWNKVLRILSKKWWGPYRKEKKWAIWTVSYWKRKDPSIVDKLSIGPLLHKYYSHVVNFEFDPEEVVWYKGKDAHIEANSIFKNNLDKTIDADLVCITVRFYNKQPEFDDYNECILSRKTSRKYFSGQKTWYYHLTK